jgi:hypothetical protein
VPILRTNSIDRFTGVVRLKRFAFELNHFDRRTRLFPKLCLGDQSDALTQVERETL